VLYGYETLRIFENRILRRIFEPKNDENFIVCDVHIIYVVVLSILILHYNMYYFAL
jgi:hypothetical protein